MAGFGAFGKMPALGDFFRLGAPPGFVKPWDAWLQDGIVASRSIMGDRWQASYLTAPVWRFSLGAGVAGPAVTVGVLMPSVDRVGRQFPLTLMAAISETASAMRVHLKAVSQFELLEEIALDTLDDAMNRDALAERLQAVPPVVVGSGAGFDIVCKNGCVAMTATFASSDAPASVMDMIGELTQDGLERACVWSAILAGETRLLITDGLPRAGQMAALFDLDAPQWRADAQEGART
ncbi:MAG: type VI secretion system-associated protein TagF [Paracoccaceae bacterium]